VVLEGPADWRAEQKKLTEVLDRILRNTVSSGLAVISSFKPVTAEDIQKRTGFMFNVRNEGIAL